MDSLVDEKLTCDHCDWKVPWCKTCCYAKRLFEGNDSLVLICNRDNFTMDSFSFTSKPFKKACSISYFTFGFSQSLSILQTQDQSLVMSAVGQNELSRECEVYGGGSAVSIGSEQSHGFGQVRSHLSDHLDDPLNVSLIGVAARMSKTYQIISMLKTQV